MRVGADLLEAGADAWDISSAVYEQQPVERLSLLREVLGTLHLSTDGLFASITVSHAMIQHAAGRSELTDGFINFARGIRGVEVAAQFSEPAPGSGDPWSLSFRSRGRVNVARVAQTFGGGGHHNAAGARIQGSFDEVVARVAAAVREEYERTQSP
jgi:phosphoesterase RecJ-like protein